MVVSSISGFCAGVCRSECSYSDRGGRKRTAKGLVYPSCSLELIDLRLRSSPPLDQSGLASQFVSTVHQHAFPAVGPTAAREGKILLDKDVQTNPKELIRPNPSIDQIIPRRILTSDPYIHTNHVHGVSTAKSSGRATESAGILIFLVKGQGDISENAKAASWGTIVDQNCLANLADIVVLLLASQSNTHVAETYLRSETWDNWGIVCASGGERWSAETQREGHRHHDWAFM